MPVTARSHRPRRPIRLAVVASLVALSAACARETQRSSRDAIEASLQAGPTPGLVLGVFPLAAKGGGVVDGDTIKVGGLDASLRLIGLDTEETFKKEKERRAYEEGWQHYVEHEQAKTSRPIKVATPYGDKAKEYAIQFFKNVRVVKLERDDPRELRDRYDRYLAYVFVEIDGKWVNYNVECVRAGMSPYFNKYGNSKRFHAEFVAAQEEARAAKRGIWADTGEHYGDYELRLRWWQGRAEFVEQFNREAEGRSDFLVLNHWDAGLALSDRIGQEVEVIGTIGAIYDSDRGGPTRVMLGRKRGDDFALVFFDPYVLEDTRLREFVGEYVRVRGTVARYRNKKSGKVSLQFIVNDPRQVLTPSYFIPRLGPESKISDDAMYDDDVPQWDQDTVEPPPGRKPQGSGTSDGRAGTPRPEATSEPPQQPSPADSSDAADSADPSAQDEATGPGTTPGDAAAPANKTVAQRPSLRPGAEPAPATTPHAMARFGDFDR